jgi:hypothetical protein
VFGLPRRVRQASLAAQQRQAESPGTAGSGAEPEDGSGSPAARPNGRPERTPEEIRLMMGSFHAASVRGRAEAERTLQPGLHADADPLPADPPTTPQ